MRSVIDFIINALLACYIWWAADFVCFVLYVVTFLAITFYVNKTFTPTSAPSSLILSISIDVLALGLTAIINVFVETTLTSLKQIFQSSPNVLRHEADQYRDLSNKGEYSALPRQDFEERADHLDNAALFIDNFVETLTAYLDAFWGLVAIDMVLITYLCSRMLFLIVILLKK
ncbi:MAG: hypothetical protein CBC55_02625 [Gammaproteobacteria bacterium TMED95]|nr:MAG: hypothetical protein CBC55_02625 [Gammaproteobacteria bacterium TMED95]|tara:strand:+ start:1773 stop:2291 length:519 start_codon:yes stop_codon:yes gene_type:complete